MSLRSGLLAASATSLALVSCASGSAASPPRPLLAPIALSVDTSDAATHVLHAKLVIPARPGPLTLYHPKWIPGTGGPSLSVADVAGLHFSSGGKPIPWRRDSVDLDAFQCD